MPRRTRTVKVFCSKRELQATPAAFDFVERYPGFQLIRVSAADARKLARKFPTEDITDQYTIRLPSGTLNTKVPRIDASGKMRTHAGYRGVKPLRPGKHHYLVQFIGPIKTAWLSRLKKLGAEPRTPYAGFTYVVRCDKRRLGKIAALPFVRWMGHLSHRDRVLIGDAKKTLPRTRMLPGAYTIEFFGKEDMRRAATAIRKLGVRITARNERARVMTVHIDSPKAKVKRVIQRLSAIHGVRAIRARALERTMARIDSATAEGPSASWQERWRIHGLPMAPTPHQDI